MRILHGATKFLEKGGLCFLLNDLSVGDHVLNMCSKAFTGTTSTSSSAINSSAGSLCLV